MLLFTNSKQLPSTNIQNKINEMQQIFMNLQIKQKDLSVEDQPPICQLVGRGGGCPKVNNLNWSGTGVPMWWWGVRGQGWGQGDPQMKKFEQDWGWSGCSHVIGQGLEPGLGGIPKWTSLNRSRPITETPSWTDKILPAMWIRKFVVVWRYFGHHLFNNLHEVTCTCCIFGENGWTSCNHRK